METLPQTIRDAILLTRAIGIDYLWVDALCIIQDSFTDWEQESTRMCAVYANATLTIAAMDSADSEMGLIPLNFQRPATQINTVEGPIYFRYNYHTPIGASSTKPCWTLPDPLHENPKTYGILTARGWTMQELALSPRILWCRELELAWSCALETAYECDPTPTETQSQSLGIFHLDFENHPPQDVPKMLQWWMEFVELYTRRDLTKPTDRLPALGGIAALVQQKYALRYLCGLWDVDIARQLLWQCTLPALLPSSPALSPEYAPSWSFGSVVGPITFKFGGIHVHSNRYINMDIRLQWSMQSIDFSPDGLNSFGPGQGVLRVHAFVVPATIAFLPIPEDARDRGLRILLSSKVGNVYKGMPLCIALHGVPDRCSELSSLNFDRRAGLYMDESLCDRELLCMTVGTWNHLLRGWRDGFLLEKYSSDVQGHAQYRRLGLWTTVIWKEAGDFRTDPCGYSFGTLEEWKRLGHWETINIV